MRIIDRVYNFVKQKGLLQFAKFAIVGVLSAILEISIFKFLLYQYSINTTLALSGGLHYYSGRVEVSEFAYISYVLIFNAIAYIFAVIFNYILSRKFVFETGRYKPKTEFLAFCAVATVGLGINQTVLYLGLQYLSVPILLNAFLNLPDFAKIMAIAVTVVWNFTMKKLVVFKG